MAADLYTITWILLMPTLVMMAGGLIIWFTSFSHRTVAGMQHFASGILFAAVAWEIAPILEPETHEEKGAVILGFLFAALLLSFLGRYDFKNWRKCQGKRREEDISRTEAPLESDHYDAIRDADLERQSKSIEIKNQSYFPLGLVIAVAFDCAIDGCLIGITYSASESAGLITSIALCIAQGLLGVSCATSLVKARVPKFIIILLSIIIPFFVLCGGLMGATVLTDMSGSTFHAVVSFGCGGLLYLVTEELMIEAHEFNDTDKWYISILFFCGFTFVVALDYYLPHHY